MSIGKGWARPKPFVGWPETVKVEVPVELVHVRVISNYGGHEPGSIIEVDARELRRVPHALIALTEEERRRDEEAQRQAQQTATRTQDPFRKMREAFARGAEEARRVMAEQHARAEAERVARAKEIAKEGK
jgi:hypothetical protein